MRLGLRPWVSSMAEVLDYAKLAFEARGPTGTPFDIEIKVDTGMGRMGVLEEGFEPLRRAVMRLRSLRLAGVVTHLPSADEDEKFTAEPTRPVSTVSKLAAARGELPRAEQRRAHRLPARRTHDGPARADALRRVAGARVQGQAAARADPEDAGGAGARHAAGPGDQLRADVHHAARDAGGHPRGGLRGRLSAPPFQRGRGGSGARAAVPGARARDDGPDHGRPERVARGGRRGGGHAHRAAGHARRSWRANWPPRPGRSRGRSSPG